MVRQYADSFNCSNWVNFVFHDRVLLLQEVAESKKGQKVYRNRAQSDYFTQEKGTF